MLPSPVAAALSAYLAPRDRMRLATLFRLPLVQAATLRLLYAHEFDRASELGDVALLDFLDRHCAEHGLPHRVTARAIDAASWRGLLDVLRRAAVLQWWIDQAFDSSMEIKYTHTAFDEACINGQICVLEKWKGSRLLVDCSENLLVRLSTEGRPDALQWLRTSPIEIKRISYGWKEPCRTELRLEFSNASRSPNLAVKPTNVVDPSVQKWWSDSLRPAMDGASGRGQAAVLEWWKATGSKLTYTPEAINSASCFGRLETLQWWKDSGLELRYTAKAMDTASGNGHTTVLQWWKDSGLGLKYSENAIHYACQNGQFRSLEWWTDSGLEIRRSKGAAEEAMGAWNPEVLEWWFRSEVTQNNFRIDLHNKKLRVMVYTPFTHLASAYAKIRKLATSAHASASSSASSSSGTADASSIAAHAAILLLVNASDPDAICAARIFTLLLKTDSLPHELLPIRGHHDLHRVATTRLSPPHPFRAVILLNCGALLDLAELFNMPGDGDDNAEVEVEDPTWVFVADSHRPHSLENLYKSRRVVVLDDGMSRRRR
ncbi:CDC45-like protein-domain-containing protein [Zopfochytrium polystomum]|nr:CDC45-like protein-domain-containing protein [Zopfochytrium polystomum]